MARDKVRRVVNRTGAVARQDGTPSLAPASAAVAAVAADVATVAGDLADHAALEVAAHGGIVADDDARLTDARTPTAHTHLEADITDLARQALHLETLANDTTELALATHTNVQLTVTADRTLTSTVPAAGTRCALKVLTSGVTSFTLTFGTGFKSTGTLATGIVDAKVFVVEFFSDGTTLIETARTAAL